MIYRHVLFRYFYVRTLKIDINCIGFSFVYQNLTNLGVRNYSLVYLLNYLLTYLLTYLLHGAESFLRS